MKKSRKLIAILATVALLATLLVPMVGPAFAGDPFKYSSAYPIISDSSNQPAGWFSVESGDQNVTFGAGGTTYVTVDLSSGAKWTTEPTTNTAVQALVTTTPASTITRIASDKDSVQFTVYNASNAVTKLVFDVPNLDITSGTTGDVTATVKLQVLDDENNQVWTESKTLVVARIGAGALTATAASAKKISGAGLGVAVADITIEENQPGVLSSTAPDTITLTIATPGVTWVAAPGPYPTASGTAGLAVGAATRTDDKTLTYTVTSPSSGIGGKLTFDLDSAGYLNVSPGVSGDIVITVASSNTKLSDTDLVVATTAVGEFTITAKDTKNREGVPGQDNVTLGDIEIDQNFAGAFNNNGSLVFTLKNAKWAGNPPAAPAGFAAGTRYNDDRSIWFSVTNPAAVPDPVTFDGSTHLPSVNIDASASGDIVVEISGTAGPSGEYVLGKVIPVATFEADKKTVNVNSLSQAAGDIKITEAGKNLFDTSGTLKLTLPNGIYFSNNPTLYINGKKVTPTWVSTPKGTNVAEFAAATWGTNFSTVRADVIEIKDIAYDVDSRFLTKDIVVEISGTFLTTAGGSTSTVATVTNATGVSATKRDASFVIGSLTYTVNGVEKAMDAAPYIKDGRTYLPVRFVADALGVDSSNILWDGKNVTLIKGDRVVQMTIGSKVMLINGASITMDVAPEVVEPGRTMLPFRWIAQALGAQVGWDEATTTVTMNIQ